MQTHSLRINKVRVPQFSSYFPAVYVKHCISYTTRAKLIAPFINKLYSLLQYESIQLVAGVVNAAALSTTKTYVSATCFDWQKTQKYLYNTGVN